MRYLWDALCTAYPHLEFGAVTKGDRVFRDLVLGRIIEPTSKVDSLRVIEEVGVEPASYATVKRRLPDYARPSWRQKLSAACAAHAGLGPASLMLYDVVVASSSMAASVIVTPNSIVRMIVSATTDDGQAVAFGKGHLGGVAVSVGACIVTHRGPTSPKRHEPAHRDVAKLRCTLDYEEP
jgi:hypothetical protein